MAADNRRTLSVAPHWHSVVDLFDEETVAAPARPDRTSKFAPLTIARMYTGHTRHWELDTNFYAHRVPTIPPRDPASPRSKRPGTAPPPLPTVATISQPQYRRTLNTTLDPVPPPLPRQHPQLRGTNHSSSSQRPNSNSSSPPPHPVLVVRKLNRSTENRSDTSSPKVTSEVHSSPSSFVRKYPPPPQPLPPPQTSTLMYRRNTKQPTVGVQLFPPPNVEKSRGRTFDPDYPDDHDINSTTHKNTFGKIPELLGNGEMETSGSSVVRCVPVVRSTSDTQMNEKFAQWIGLVGRGSRGTRGGGDGTHMTQRPTSGDSSSWIRLKAADGNRENHEPTTNYFISPSSDSPQPTYHPPLHNGSNPLPTSVRLSLAEEKAHGYDDGRTLHQPQHQAEDTSHFSFEGNGTNKRMMVSRNEEAYVWYCRDYDTIPTTEVYRELCVDKLGEIRHCTLENIKFPSQFHLLAVFGVLSHNSELSTLSLRSCSLDDSLVTSLVDFCRVHANLQAVMLDNNPMITDASAFELLQLVHDECRFTTVSLQGTSVSVQLVDLIDGHLQNNRERQMKIVTQL